MVYECVCVSVICAHGSRIWRRKKTCRKENILDRIGKERRHTTKSHGKALSMEMKEKRAEPAKAITR